MGVKATGAQGWQNYHFSVPIVLKSGSFKLLNRQGLSRPVMGFLYLLQEFAWKWSYLPKQVANFCKTIFFIIKVVVFDWNYCNRVFRFCHLSAARCVPSQRQTLPSVGSALCAFAETDSANCRQRALILPRGRQCHLSAARCVPSHRQQCHLPPSDVTNFRRY
jgi:hypothetical protein